MFLKSSCNAIRIEGRKAFVIITVSATIDPTTFNGSRDSPGSGVLFKNCLPGSSLWA